MCIVSTNMMPPLHSLQNHITFTQFKNNVEAFSVCIQEYKWMGWLG